jgi:cytochrome P450 family 9
LYFSRRIYGLSGLGTFLLILKDPSFIKQVTIKGSDSFINRSKVGDKMLGRALLFLRDHEWKEIRLMLTPIYTSFKLKIMYELLLENMEEFTKLYTKKAKAKGDEIEIETHDVYGRTVTDAIATTALGFTSDCVKNKDSKIFEMANAIHDDFTSIKAAMAFTFYKIFSFFGLQIFRKNIHDYFTSKILSEVHRRREGKNIRSDVIQMLIQAKEGKLKLEIENDDELNYTETKVKKNYKLV